MGEAMIDDRELAALAAAAYVDAPSCAAGDVHACLTEREDALVVAFRGTVPTNWADWWRDFQAWPHAARDHPDLGPCHDGFLSGVEAIWPLLRPLLVDRRVVVTGHSLGGALALVAGALLASAGARPVQLATFGAPKAGGAKLASLLHAVPGEQYRNGNDPVPDVPAMWFVYQHTRKLNEIGAPCVDPVACHALLRYRAALVAGAPS